MAKRIIPLTNSFKVEDTLDPNNNVLVAKNDVRINYSISKFGATRISDDFPIIETVKYDKIQDHTGKSFGSLDELLSYTDRNFYSSSDGSGAGTGLPVDFFNSEGQVNSKYLPDIDIMELFSSQFAKVNGLITLLEGSNIPDHDGGETDTGNETGSGSGLPLTQFNPLQFAEQKPNLNDLASVADTDGNNASALAVNKFLPGAVGFVRMVTPTYTDTGESASGYLCVADNTNLFGPNNTIMAIHAEGVSTLIVNKGSESNGFPVNVSPGTFLRLRLDGNFIYAEVSTDDVNYTIKDQIAQPDSILYIQFSIASTGNQRRINGIVAEGVS